MFISQLIRRQSFTFIFFFLLFANQAVAQSVLLVRSNTVVYDSYNEGKIPKLTLKSETWVNYKGKYGDYFKVSNFFGKDKYYPAGIFEGYVNLNSVLDTASREEYEAYIELDVKPPQSADSENIYVKHVSSPLTFDIDSYYLGMPEKEALKVNKSSLAINGSNYQVVLRYTSSRTLYIIELNGDKRDALAVDGPIKSQIEELRQVLQKKNGRASELKKYPSFLEVGEGATFNVATWLLPGKKITLGLAEMDNLYYSKVVFQKN